MLYNFTFLLSSLFFFFLKIWSEIGIRIIHGPALYTGKYGNTVKNTIRKLDQLGLSWSHFLFK